MRTTFARLLAAVVLLAVPLAGAPAAAQEPSGDLESFVTLLRGDAVVPPAPTRAAGIASFLHTVGTGEVRSSVSALGTTAVTGVHLHLAPVGENGPVVADLRLGTDTITAADLEGPLAGAGVDDLVELMRTGGVFVDVHTARFPDGELRGQVHGRRGTG